MKKRNLFFAITMMAVATAVSVAMVSCKKDTSEQTSAKGTDSQAFDYRQIDDKVAYFTDFKKKMKESKNNESFNLDDAAWHLACLANIGFCNVNVKYDDFLFDTIDIQVEVEDGGMSLANINVAYDQMCAKIQQFKKGFDHSDQNLYYINVSIDAGGNAKVALMTSFTDGSKYLTNHTWYFSDDFEAAEACDEYFSDDSTYYWNGLAASELQRVLNIFEHHENGVGMFGVVCYIPTRSHTFDYTNTYDPYYSGYYYINESRVFAKKYTSPYPNYIFQLFEMCYCLDSYLGLGYDYIDDGLYDNEHPVNWIINCISVHPNPSWYYYYHQLKVEYGIPITQDPTPND